MLLHHGAVYSSSSASSRDEASGESPTGIRTILLVTKARSTGCLPNTNPLLIHTYPLILSTSRTSSSIIPRWQRRQWRRRYTRPPLHSPNPDASPNRRPNLHGPIQHLMRPSVVVESNDLASPRNGGLPTGPEPVRSRSRRGPVRGMEWDQVALSGEDV